MKRYLARLAVLIIGVVLLATPAGAREIRMATTTSMENSGLLKFILPAFEAKTGIKVHVIAVGTGKALKIGENGDVDVVLVHARADEDKFVAAGHGVNRRDVMYNDFILVGPKDDPAKIRGGQDVVDAFRKIATTQSRFVSRGDDSGTHKMELSYWEKAKLTPKGEWYISAGQGMGEVLMMSAEMQAYTLSDRGTYIPYKARTGLEILLVGDPRMFNPYGIIAVNPKKYPDLDYEGAMALIDWITSAEGQQKIADFKVDGVQLFIPDAKGTPKP